MIIAVNDKFTAGKGSGRIDMAVSTDTYHLRIWRA